MFGQTSKNYSDLTSERLVSLGIIDNELTASLEHLEHHRTMVSRGSSEPIMLKSVVKLSANRSNFFCSMDVRESSLEVRNVRVIYV